MILRNGRPKIELTSLTAVDCALQATDFINSNISYIYQRLVRCDNHVVELYGNEGNDYFLAECRDVTDAIVHLGASLRNYRVAKKYVVQKFGIQRGDPGVVLPILVLVYINLRITEYRNMMQAHEEDQLEAKRNFIQSLQVQGRLEQDLERLEKEDHDRFQELTRLREEDLIRLKRILESVRGDEPPVVDEDIVKKKNDDQLSEAFSRIHEGIEHAKRIAEIPGLEPIPPAKGSEADEEQARKNRQALRDKELNKVWDRISVRVQKLSEFLGKRDS